MPLQASPDSSEGAERPALAVTGLAREARIAAGEGVVTLCCGGSPSRLRALLETWDGPLPGAVVSFGIAGGLDPALRAGQAVVATGVASEGRVLDADPALAAVLLRRMGAEAVPGRLAAAEAALLDPAAKAALRGATGAAAVDLESGPAAAYAARRGLPFAAIRVVCDPAGRRLPALALTALKPDGGVDLAAVLGGLLREPGQLPALISAGRDSRLAFQTLSRLRRLLGHGLGLGRDLA